MTDKISDSNEEQEEKEQPMEVQDENESNKKTPLTPPKPDEPNNNNNNNNISSNNNNSNEAEARIQVDRRQLELLLTCNTGDGRTSLAEAFFNEVQRITSCKVFWPSRLKIGAKTKKDPFVRLLGPSASDVGNAKSIILNELRPKNNRVTLKIDVSYTDHSHIIGRGGKNTQFIMRQTGCHIHFPDSNKNREVDKSNQVSIGGSIIAVETARHQLRVGFHYHRFLQMMFNHIFPTLAPLTITFQLVPSRPGIDFEKLSSHPSLEKVCECPDISVIVRLDKDARSHETVPKCVVRGSLQHEASIVRAVNTMVDRCMLPETTPQLTCTLEILPGDQRRVCGQDNRNMVVVARHTGVQIKHPSLFEATRGHSTFLFVGPSVQALAVARKYVLGFLPVHLTFDLYDSATPFPFAVEGEYAALECEFGVQIYTKWKQNSDGTPVKMMTIKASECQLPLVYACRARLLNEPFDDKLLLTNEYAFMQSTVCLPPPPPPPTSAPMSPRAYLTAPAMPVFSAAGQQPQLSPEMYANAAAMQQQMHQLPLLVSSHQAALYQQAALLHHHHHQQQQQQQQQPPPLAPTVSQLMYPVVSQAAAAAAGNSGGPGGVVALQPPPPPAQPHNQQHNVEYADIPPTQAPASSPTGSSTSEQCAPLAALMQAVQQHEQQQQRALTGGMAHLTLHRQQQLHTPDTPPPSTEPPDTDAHSQSDALDHTINADMLDRSMESSDGRDPVPEESPLANGVLQITKNNASNDWRIVGAERSAVSEYQKQRIRAQKAMQELPTGGVRKPNDEWCGMGFSHTTHSDMLRTARQQAAVGQAENVQLSSGSSSNNSSAASPPPASSGSSGSEHFNASGASSSSSSHLFMHNNNGFCASSSSGNGGVVRSATPPAAGSPVAMAEPATSPLHPQQTQLGRRRSAQMFTPSAPLPTLTEGQALQHNSGSARRTTTDGSPPEPSTSTSRRAAGVGSGGFAAMGKHAGFGASSLFESGRPHDDDALYAMCESTEDVLCAIGCSYLAQLFAEHEVDVDTLLGLDEGDLREMGIRNAELKKITQAIFKLRALRGWSVVQGWPSS